MSTLPSSQIDPELLKDHLACPKCGYDLHGIPEHRCPECGFGYDAAAVRSMAKAFERARVAVAQVVINKVAIALALTTPAFSDRIGIGGLAKFVLMASAYVGAFLTWVILTGAYAGPSTFRSLLTGFVAIPVVAIWIPGTPRFLNSITFMGAGFMLAWAWWLRVRH